jgi:hypothetical protein
MTFKQSWIGHRGQAKPLASKEPLKCAITMEPAESYRAMLCAPPLGLPVKKKIVPAEELIA